MVFILVFTPRNSVDHMNFMTRHGNLNTIAQQAHGLPLQPGDTMAVQLTAAGTLEVGSYSPIMVRRDGESRLFITVDTGGGHLGNQGYIYSEDKDFNVVGAEGFPLVESYEYKRLNDHWWSYDSVED